MSPNLPAPVRTQLASVPTLRRSLRSPILTGTAVCLVFFGGLGAWSTLAPLASAALGPGIVSPDGNRRTVQHLEGGIVEKLLVRDGSRVEAGDPLIVLQDEAARSDHDLAQTQHDQLAAIKARLEAERDGLLSPRFPQAMLKRANHPDVAALLIAQQDLMEQRRTALVGRKTLLEQRIAQIEEEIAGHQAQIESSSAQLAIIEEEIGTVSELVAKGLTPKPRLLALQRDKAEIAGRRAASQSAIARARQSIGEAQQQIANLDVERLEAVSTELAEVTSKLAEARERLGAAADVLQRIVITAPVAGTVVQSTAHTLGGVIRAGEPILDIVPRDDDLLIDARIAPTDIDVVREGLPAQVVLSAFKQRTMPRIEGRVRSVSADRIVDPQSKSPYYLVRVEVDRESLAAIGPEVDLTPGMPAEVMVMTGLRTAFDYLTQPFFDSLRRSLRES